MKLGEKLKGFLKMSGHYSETSIYLAEHGYDDTYMEMLAETASAAKKKADIAEGQALTAQAYLFRGQFRNALEAFETAEVEKMPSHLNAVFVNNYILLLFLIGKTSRVKEIYEQYNQYALADDTLVMRRTIGIKEFCEKRYENAVTVFIKLCNEPDPRVTLMADICVVKAMLALDMNERAKEIADLGFGRYNGKGDITAEVNRLKMKMDGHGQSKKSSKGKKK